MEFIESANDYNVFVYKNWKGEKQFVSAVANSMKPINSQVMEISLTLTEIDFVESKMYSGDTVRRIIYINGKYYLDGTYDLTAYGDIITSV